MSPEEKTLKQQQEIIDRFHALDYAIRIRKTEDSSDTLLVDADKIMLWLKKGKISK